MGLPGSPMSKKTRGVLRRAIITRVRAKKMKKETGKLYLANLLSPFPTVTKAMVYGYQPTKARR